MLTLTLGLTYGVHYILSDGNLSAQAGYIYDEPYKKLKVEQDSNRLTLYFSKNSYLISQPDQIRLQKTAEYLLRNPDWNVFIHAHSWDGGNATQEMLLSEKRSLEIFRFFIVHNVKEDQIQRLFYGNSKPLPQGLSASDGSLQRRAEIFLEPK